VQTCAFIARVECMHTIPLVNKRAAVYTCGVISGEPSFSAARVIGSDCRLVETYAPRY